MIDNDGSMMIEDMAEVDENLYYIYVTDYKFSNMTGINVLGVSVNENSIEHKRIISENQMPQGFSFVLGALYYDNSHIYYEELDDHGREVVVKANDRTFLLKLETDGLYYIFEKQINLN